MSKALTSRANNTLRQLEAEFGYPKEKFQLAQELNYCDMETSYTD